MKPGWIFLGLVTAWAVAATLIAAGPRAPADPGRLAGEPVAPDRGFWFPIPGARVPDDPFFLPNAPREYRQGTSEGFDFFERASGGVPIQIGTGVVAARSGEVIRADLRYQELTPAEFQALVDRGADGRLTAEDLDRLRGRQIWIEHPGGVVTRYAHLFGIAPGLQVGSKVVRGQFIGFVGNSGTSDGVRGRRTNARLRFEVWYGERFFGQGLTVAQVREAARRLFSE